MKYKDFYLNEHESDGPIAIDADQLTTQPCEDIAGLTIGRELTDKDKAGLISARGVFPKNNEKEIYEKNLIKAKELLNKINMVKDQRGAKTKLMALGITGSQIAAIISGLNYSGKSVYSTDEGKAIVKELLPLLKNIFKVGVCSVLNKSTMDEALILKRSGDKLDVIIKEKESDVKTQLQGQMNESFKSVALAGLLGASSIVAPQTMFAGSNKPTMTQSADARGIRNNNPGNIRISKDNWNGIAGNDGQFLKFDSPENGIRALYKTLKTYNTKYGINTVDGIISRWAPKKENDTSAYIKFVSNKTGIKSDAILDVHDKSAAVKLIKAIIEKENGKNPYNDSIIMSAINKA